MSLKRQVRIANGRITQPKSIKVIYMVLCTNIYLYGMMEDELKGHASMHKALCMETVLILETYMRIFANRGSLIAEACLQFILFSDKIFLTTSFGQETQLQVFVHLLACVQNGNMWSLVPVQKPNS